MVSVKRILKTGISFVGVLIALCTPYGLVLLGVKGIEHLKKALAELPSINESTNMNENVMVILKNGVQTKKYNSKRRFKQWVTH